jgi:translation initiation factor IF-3
LIKRHKKKPEQKKWYRTNEKIFATSLRVLDSTGQMIGVMSKYDALQKAREEGLDLVEVASHAKPPVAKLIDFKKFLYQEEKKKREEKKKAKTSETKEVRLGPFMSDNDLMVMVNRAREFIQDGDKVRLVVKFKGRQITKTDFGAGVISKVAGSLSDIAKIEKDPRMEGRQMVAILSQEKKSAAPKGESAGEGEKTNEINEKKDQEINSETV